MSSLVSNPDAAAGLDLIFAGIRMVQGADLTPSSIHDATIQTRELTKAQAMLDSVSVDAMDAIDGSGVGATFGHLNAKVLVRHEAKLSNAEALGRDQSRKALAALPKIQAAYRDGEIGTDQVRRLARLWANKRVRTHLEAAQDRFLLRAQTLPYKRFHAYATDWERRADEDGWINQTERQHQNRTFSIGQDYDTSFSIRGGMGAVQGAECHDIFTHYVEAELLTDLQFAKEQRLDPSEPLAMPRTAAQRRADAFHRICLDAVATQPGGKQPRWIRNVVIDDVTFKRELARLEGNDLAADDPDRNDYQCETLDGLPLDPIGLVASMHHPFRRHVIDAAGVTVDLGEQRFFTGSARAAVQLASHECYWPGCGVRVSACQIDHLRSHCNGGRTNPRNGGAACGRHNRLKESRFSVSRDHSGQIVVRTDYGLTVT